MIIPFASREEIPQSVGDNSNTKRRLHQPGLQEEADRLETLEEIVSSNQERDKLMTAKSHISDIVLHDYEGYGSIERKVQHEHSRTRAEIESLKHVLLIGLSKREFALGTTPSAAIHMNEQENANLVAEVGKELVKSPNTLKRVCDHVDVADQQPLRGFFRRSRLVKCTCSQPTSQRQRFWQKGRFFFDHDFSQIHERECPSYYLHVRKWRYTFSAQLLPFLNKVVQVTFMSTSGAGGASISPSLRYFGIVERSKSPAFKLFDALPDVCARRINITDENLDIVARGQLTHWDNTGSLQLFHFEWDLERLKLEVPRLCRELSELLGTGQSAASNSDESGNMLLHVSTLKSLVTVLLFGLYGRQGSLFLDSFSRISLCSLFR